MRNALVKIFARLRKDEKGVTLVEYGIALILAITVGGAALSGLGTATQGQFTDASTCMTSGGSC